jgi:hypothetical protein
MAKRRRPSRHYRVIKTKKGKKKILVNKDVKKPVTRKRNMLRTKAEQERAFILSNVGIKKERIPISPFELREAGIDEIKRRIQQQIEMNKAKDIERAKREEKELEKIRDKERDLRFELRDIDNKNKAEEERLAKIERGKLQALSNANRRIMALESQFEKLGRKRKSENILNYADEKDMYLKLSKAKDLAIKSGNRELIEKVQSMEQDLNKKLAKPRFETGRMSGNELNYFKAGQAMLDAPEYKGPAIPIGEAAKPVVSLEEQERRLTEAANALNELQRARDITPDLLIKRKQLAKFAANIRREVENDSKRLIGKTSTQQLVNRVDRAKEMSDELNNNIATYGRLLDEAVQRQEALKKRSRE